MLENNKNWDVLKSLISYCIDHPDQRFWQALTNWAGFSFIGKADTAEGDGFVDLYYREGK